MLAALVISHTGSQAKLYSSQVSRARRSRSPPRTKASATHVTYNNNDYVSFSSPPLASCRRRRRRGEVAAEKEERRLPVCFGLQHFLPVASALRLRLGLDDDDDDDDDDRRGSERRKTNKGTAFWARASVVSY